jgi:predicted metal-dependent enzyme (double-stranded beta helix superfamily)
MNRGELLEMAVTYDRNIVGEAEKTHPHYFRKTIHRDDDVEVVLVCFDEMQSTSVHDHGGSMCVVRCLKGSVLEQTFEKDAEGNLVHLATVPLGAGGIKYIDPKFIHQVTNLAKDGSVLINFYSPPLPPIS